MQPQRGGSSTGHVSDPPITMAGVMLPAAIIFLQLLLNDREMLGERFANRPWNNWINWTVIALLFALSFLLVGQVLSPDLFPSAIAQTGA